MNGNVTRAVPKCPWN